jgi:hypothetical protein
MCESAGGWLSGWLGGVIISTWLFTSELHIFAIQLKQFGTAINTLGKKLGNFHS